MRMYLVNVGLVVLTAVCAPRVAQAYPQWQFASGTTRCGQCHFNPAGGGLITGYGRDAVGDDLSTWKGNGAFLHGAVELPAWLALGVDTRGALLSHDNGSPSGAQISAFPMQADVQGRVAFLNAFSASVTAGVRGQARPSPAPIASRDVQPSPASRFVSREHYLMWRPEAQGPYARVGRFFAPFGLRLAEHTSYVRRDLGANLLEETDGVSGGFVSGDWDLHVTAFIPDVLHQAGGNEKGAAALFERRLADKLALGVSGRAGQNDDRRRYVGGAFAKLYVEPAKVLLMAEGDVVQLAVNDHGSVGQFVGYAGLTVFPVRGLWLSIMGERFQDDLRIKNSASNALDGQLNWFPYPHFEIVVLGRLQTAGGQDSAKTLMGQIHYFL